MSVWTIARIATVCGMLMDDAAHADGNIGVRQLAAPSPERGVSLDVTVWYPAQAGGEQVMLGESTFFKGTPAARNAPIMSGRFPVILLSHGAGLAGSPEAISWLAAPLAQQGFMVAAPMHPGNSGKNRSAEETMKIWLRPGDLTDTLDAIENEPLLKEHLVQSRIGALGLSMGGSTALGIAGARIDPTLLTAYCDTDTLNRSLCDWVRQSGVDLHAMDLKAAGRDNQDKRIRFAMAIDPGLIDVFDFSSFSAVSIPVDLVNLGPFGNIPPSVDASAAAKAMPSARYEVIEDASHFSMFAECKPGASEIAQSQNIDDPICTDRGGRSRSRLHTQLIDMTTAAFSRALKDVR